MLSLQLVAVASLLTAVSAQTSSSTSSSAAAAPTEVTDCHTHGEDIFCFADGGDEWELTGSEYDADNVPDSFEGCHMHDEELHCVDGETEATLVSPSSEEDHDHDDEDHDHDHAATTSAPSTSATAASNSNSTMTTSTSSTSSSSSMPTAVTSCHTHDETELYCLDGSDEWVVTSDWDSNDPPESFDDCHSHGDELHCVDGDNDATLVASTEAHVDDDSSSTTGSSGSPTSSSSSSSETADADSAASEAFAVSSMGMMLGGVVLAYAAYVC